MVDLLKKIPVTGNEGLIDKPRGDGKYMPVGTEDGVKYRKIITPDDIRREKKMSGSEPGKLIMPKDDPRYEALVEKRICINCIYHNRPLAAKAMRDQQFIERLLHDERYKTEWFNDFRKFGICEVFSDDAGTRLVDGDAPAVCAASDADSTKLPGTPEGQEQIPCPHWEEATESGKLVATRHGVRGVGRRNQEAANAYIEEHQKKKPYYDRVSGRKENS